MYLQVSVDELISSFQNAQKYAEAHNMGNEASMFARLVRDLDSIRKLPSGAFTGDWGLMPAPVPPVSDLTEPVVRRGAPTPPIPVSPIGSPYPPPSPAFDPRVGAVSPQPPFTPVGNAALGQGSPYQPNASPPDQFDTKTEADVNSDFKSNAELR